MPNLELVLKADVAGTLEAISTTLQAINISGVDLKIIQAGVGPVSKADLLMAQTGSKLVIGFNVKAAPKLEKQIIESGIEVRLYEVIYNLSKDVENICRQLEAKEPKEKITGEGKVIATFKAGKGMIIGCEVTKGIVESGKHFRIITAMGPSYTGRIESLQIERKAVKIGKIGQQVGIHIPNWEKAKVGDLIECFEAVSAKDGIWRPKPGIFNL